MAPQIQVFSFNQLLNTHITGSRTTFFENYGSGKKQLGVSGPVGLITDILNEITIITRIFFPHHKIFPAEFRKILVPVIIKSKNFNGELSKTFSSAVSFIIAGIILRNKSTNLKQEKTISTHNYLKRFRCEKPKTRFPLVKNNYLRQFQSFGLL